MLSKSIQLRKWAAYAILVEHLGSRGAPAAHHLMFRFTICRYDSRADVFTICRYDSRACVFDILCTYTAIN